MNKSFHAVEESRKWRNRVSRDVAGMGPHEKVAYFRRFNSVAALKTKPSRAKALAMKRNPGLAKLLATPSVVE